MASKELAFDLEARQHLLAGVEKLANAVKAFAPPLKACDAQRFDAATGGVQQSRLICLRDARHKVTRPFSKA